MNQEYRNRVKRHLEAGGDPKYVNVKKKADKRHDMAKKLYNIKDAHRRRSSLDIIRDKKSGM